MIPETQGRFFRRETISDQARDEMPHASGHTAMPRVFNLAEVLQLIVDGLQAGTLTEPQLIPPPHAPIFHALADLRQQFEPLGKGGLLRCLPTKLFVFSYDMASDTLWERDETPSYRKKSAHCSRRAKSFDAAQCTLAGVELIHMIKKRQLVVEAEDESLTAAEQFYALAA
jgi:hypothetical protein